MATFLRQKTENTGKGTKRKRDENYKEEYPSDDDKAEKEYLRELKQYKEEVAKESKGSDDELGQGVYSDDDLCQDKELASEKGFSGSSDIEDKPKRKKLVLISTKTHAASKESSDEDEPSDDEIEEDKFRKALERQKGSVVFHHKDGDIFDDGHELDEDSLEDNRECAAHLLSEYASAKHSSIKQPNLGKFTGQLVEEKREKSAELTKDNDSATKDETGEKPPKRAKISSPAR